MLYAPESRHQAPEGVGGGGESPGGRDTRTARGQWALAVGVRKRRTKLVVVVACVGWWGLSTKRGHSASTHSAPSSACEL